MVSLLQRGSARLRLHTIAQYFCVHCNGWLSDTYASWWFWSNFLSILKPQSRWSIVVPRNFNMFDKTLMPDVVKPSMDATVHFLVSECLLERKIMWTPSKPSLSSLVISAKLYPIYLPAFDPVLRAALHFLDIHHFPFPHPLFWHMLDANSIPETAIPRLRRQESIISGASIFYGSVSNAVIGEAIAAGDQGQRNESTSRLITDEVDNDLSWPFFVEVWKWLWKLGRKHIQHIHFGPLQVFEFFEVPYVLENWSDSSAPRRVAMICQGIDFQDFTESKKKWEIIIILDSPTQ